VIYDQGKLMEVSQGIVDKLNATSKAVKCVKCSHAGQFLREIHSDMGAKKMRFALVDKCPVCGNAAITKKVAVDLVKEGVVPAAA